MFTIRLVRDPVEPTAARHRSPCWANRPTTTTSAALNNSCNMLERISGTVNSSSFFKIGPWVMSISYRADLWKAMGVFILFSCGNSALL